RGAAPMRFRRVVMLCDSQPLAGALDGLMQGLFQQFARRQFRQLLRNPDAALVELEQLDMFFGLASAQDQPQRRLLAGPRLVLLKPAEIQFHLPLVGRSELFGLEFYRDKPAKAAVVE